MTNYEWRVMRLHPLLGWELLSGIPGVEEEAQIVYSHHERYDGEGYPRGVALEDYLGGEPFRYHSVGIDSFLIPSNEIRVLEEEVIQMSRRHVPRDFGSIQNDQTTIACFRRSDGVGAILVGEWDIRAVRGPLDVIGQGNRIQPLTQSLLDADVRPHRAIGKNRVDMEVALQRTVARNIGKCDWRIAVNRAGKHRRHDDRQNAGKTSQPIRSRSRNHGEWYGFRLGQATYYRSTFGTIVSPTRNLRLRWTAVATPIDR